MFTGTVEYHDKNAQGKYLFEIKDLYDEIDFKSKSSIDVSQKSDEIFKSKFSKKNTLVLYLKENDKNMIIYFLNNEKEKSRCFYSNFYLIIEFLDCYIKILTKKVYKQLELYLNLW